MLNYKLYKLLFAFSLLLISCGKDLPTLNGMDLDAWKEDKKGCAEVRAKMIESLTKEKEKLKSLTEMQVIELLGRPDENELYTRNQKFYNYYLEPGPSCGRSIPQPKKLIVRFTAMGIAKETLIE